jgi:hypothetical protein
MIDAKLTPQEIQSLEKLMSRTVELVCQKSGIGRTCLSCAFFREGEDVCTFYAPPMRPPARVIVESCPAWSEAPF